MQDAHARVFAYNASLVRTDTVYLVTPRGRLAGARFGQYAMFAGGISGSASPNIDAFNQSLTRTNPFALGGAGRYNLAGATVGDYLIFAGGTTSATTSLATVDAYTSAMVKVATVTALSQARESLSGLSLQDYALFAGGRTDQTNYNRVDSYSRTLVRGAPTVMTVTRNACGATNAGNFAIFGGGWTGSVNTDVADAYTNALVKTSPATLSLGRNACGAASIDGTALIAGGISNVRWTNVDVFDANVVRSVAEPLTAARSKLVGASVGSCAIFAGGEGSLTAVDAYKL